MSKTDVSKILTGLMLRVEFSDIRSISILETSALDICLLEEEAIRIRICSAEKDIVLLLLPRFNLELSSGSRDSS
jgi:hypothetical protein